MRMPPAALAADPCFEPIIRLPLPASRGRIRVVELLATGSSGGAQEHVYNLVTRLDPELHPASVLRWFTTPNPDLVAENLGGRTLSPREWLRSGLPVQAVAERAAYL